MHSSVYCARISKPKTPALSLAPPRRHARRLKKHTVIFVKKINAMCVVMGEENYAPYIDKANTYVAEMQTILKDAPHAMPTRKKKRVVKKKHQRHQRQRMNKTLEN